jgi:glyoxylase-like metal-dependent hydrolase (beta-lactamase superfamily II)
LLSPSALLVLLAESSVWNPYVGDVITIELAAGAYALCSEDQRFGNSNIGLVIDNDGMSLIDSLCTPALAAEADAEVQELTGHLELPIKRVVLTSSRIPFTGGSTIFWRAAFFGSESVSDQLDQPVNTMVLKRLIPQHAVAFHGEFITRPVTHTINEVVHLSGAAVVHLLPGESALNTVVQLPGSDVVFLGALGSFGVTPLAFDGDPSAWADSLEALGELGTIFVPGHGLPAGRSALADQAAYLRACVEADGDPFAVPSGPWDRWTDRRFDDVNVERAARLARGDPSTPEAMFRLLGIGSR